MQVLVLNSTYQPINITTLARGFKLVFKGKAEILECIKGNPIVTDKKEFKRPTVIRLLKYVSVPFRKVHLCRQNIFKRDEFKCLYCGSENNLTIDHVMPSSRGGRNSWENLATCCKGCNGKKGNKTPEEANMQLSAIPFKPSYINYIRKFENIHKTWEFYVKK
jgi:5-methylcytosine-specific restriction endonuclease McrA